jgi:hypothetical protein
MLMMVAGVLLLAKAPLAAMTLDAVAPGQVQAGQTVNMVATGQGLSAVSHLLLTLALGEVSTDIAKAAALGTVYGVSGAGDLLYVAGGNKGLQIVNVQDLGSPQLIASWPTSGYALGVTVVGDLAYVADGGDGLTIIDVTNPAQPLLVGHLDTPGYAVGVAVAGDQAVVADLTSVQIIDVSDPAHPRPQGVLAMDGPVGRVCVAGGMSYVASGGSTIAVIDISEPGKPRVVQTIAAFGKAYGVAIVGTTLYVADGASGVRAIDVTDPSSPILTAATLDTPGKAADCSVANGRLYVADLSSLQVADIVGGGLLQAGQVAMADNLFAPEEVDAQGYVTGSGQGLVVPAPLTIVPTAKAATSLNFTLPTLTIAGRYRLAAVAGATTATLPDTVAVSAATLAPEAGWNLLGARTVVPAGQLFTDPALYASVWKWADAGSGSKTWAVYLPGGKDGTGALDGGAAYAASKGFATLSLIAPGEGFWVNCLQAGEALGLAGALAEGGLTVVNGWNLVAVHGEKGTTVAELIAAKQASVVSLWKWTDTGKGSKTWAVNLPGGKSSSGQPDSGASYAQSKGFGLLTTIGPGEGFWINIATQEAALTLP